MTEHSQKLGRRVLEDEEIVQLLPYHEHLRMNEMLESEENLYDRMDDLMDTKELDKQKDDLFRSQEQLVAEIKEEKDFFEGFITEVLRNTDKPLTARLEDGESEETHFLLTEDELNYKGLKLRLRKFKPDGADEEMSVIEANFDEIASTDLLTFPNLGLVYKDPQNTSIVKRLKDEEDLFAVLVKIPEIGLLHFYSDEANILQGGDLTSLQYLISTGGQKIAQISNHLGEQFIASIDQHSVIYGQADQRILEDGSPILIYQNGVKLEHDPQGKVFLKYVGYIEDNNPCNGFMRVQEEDGPILAQCKINDRNPIRNDMTCEVFCEYRKTNTYKTFEIRH